MLSSSATQPLHNGAEQTEERGGILEGIDPAALGLPTLCETLVSLNRLATEAAQEVRDVVRMLEHFRSSFYVDPVDATEWTPTCSSLRRVLSLSRKKQHDLNKFICRMECTMDQLKEELQDSRDEQNDGQVMVESSMLDIVDGSSSSADSTSGGLFG